MQVVLMGIIIPGSYNSSAQPYQSCVSARLFQTEWNQRLYIVANEHPVDKKSPSFRSKSSNRSLSRGIWIHERIGLTQAHEVQKSLRRSAAGPLSVNDPFVIRQASAVVATSIVNRAERQKEGTGATAITTLNVKRGSRIWKSPWPLVDRGLRRPLGEHEFSSEEAVGSSCCCGREPTSQASSEVILHPKVLARPAVMQML